MGRKNSVKADIDRLRTKWLAFQSLWSEATEKRVGF